ncbi:hypothetical protein NDU88_005712 [Pleurodeles waltl]|uniref:Uncharacterized protein n=1 Tax=Pleurodeles waltl TaxID=8319 RepID=A0AAV7NT17_PLEWA|nr:hypothetical protein NDU88_005712 [Pleurodeles waltl]
MIARFVPLPSVGPRPALVLITVHQRRHEATQGRRPPLGRIAVCFPVRQRSAVGLFRSGTRRGWPQVSPFNCWLFGRIGIFRTASYRPGVSAALRGPQHTFVVTHDTRESLSATASLPLSPGQRGLPRVQRSLSAPLGRCPRAGARP